MEQRHRNLSSRTSETRSANMSHAPNNSHAKRSTSRALVPARTALVKAQSAELPKYVTLDEVHRAADALERRPEVRALLLGLWYTGARISEILSVTVADVDFRAKLVRLPTLKRKKPTVRTVPLPESYLGELAVYLTTSGLKTGDRLFPWSRVRAFELVQAALLAAGVERGRAKPHALRHGHAIHALAGGAPLNVVQRALGHALVSTTSVYLAVTGEDVRRYYGGIDW
jgi:integrase/recombinase XerD